MFGGTLADLQLTQATLGDMATADRRGGAAHLSRGVAARRATAQRTTQEAAMAKLAATEIGAARDRRGGADARRPRASCAAQVVERLYREIRALRIYEGATEVQKLIIGREALRPFRAPGPAT